MIVNSPYDVEVTFSGVLIGKEGFDLMFDFINSQPVYADQCHKGLQIGLYWENKAYRLGQYLDYLIDEYGMKHLLNIKYKGVIGERMRFENQ